MIPLFRDQIRNGGPVTLTSLDMTRFLLSLEQAVDTVFAALREGRRGETYIPRVSSARIEDVALALIGDRSIEVEVIGVRPGEKLHEILISEEEAHRAISRGDYYVVQPVLPELREDGDIGPTIGREYSSADDVMSVERTAEFLDRWGLLSADDTAPEGELLR